MNATKIYVLALCGLVIGVSGHRKLGETCGGYTIHPGSNNCNDGLECVFPEPEPPFFFAPEQGTCQEIPESAYGEVFEGDMVLDAEQMAWVKDESDDPFTTAQAVIGQSSRKWSKKNGQVTIPYVLEDEDKFPEHTLRYFGIAIRAVAHVTCVKFVRRTNQFKYVSVRTSFDEDCRSTIGKKRRNRIWLGKLCKLGDVEHELLHTIGLYHEQSRPDRDNYIKINWDNIREDKKHNFDKCKNCHTQGLPYDLHSLMHYGRTAWSKDGKSRTIDLRDPQSSFNINRMGQKNGITELDAAAVNQLYQCPMKPCVECPDSCEGDSGCRSCSVFTRRTCTSCGESTCVERVPEPRKRGETCNASLPCESYLSCHQGTCQPKPYCLNLDGSKFVHACVESLYGRQDNICGPCGCRDCALIEPEEVVDEHGCRNAVKEGQWCNCNEGHRVNKRGGGFVGGWSFRYHIDGIGLGAYKCVANAAKYTLIEEKLTHGLCNRECGGSMAIPRDAIDTQTIKDLIPEQTRVWVGISRNVPSDNWKIGRTSKNFNGPFFWGPGEGYDGFRAAMVFDVPSYAGKWYDMPNDGRKHICVCEDRDFQPRRRSVNDPETPEESKDEMRAPTESTKSIEKVTASSRKLSNLDYRLRSLQESLLA